ncbi:MAG: pseudouridine synthase [Betaproteobacteria bacterium]|nr:pseudouridine synthase [Betaproteobacteria bacterium]
MNPRRPPSSPKPPTNPPQAERLQKLLAAAGHGSRREIEAWISAGRLKINGATARLGDRAQASDRIELDGKTLVLKAAGAVPRVLLYHKPDGEMVTRSDPEGRPTVFQRLPPIPGGKWVAVGRLDINTAGLLLFTDSGELANRLMHPRYEVQREYAVRVLGALQPEERRQLLAGVALDDGVARFDTLEPSGAAEGANRWYRATLREGRNREVRRLFEAIGRKVSRLLRVRYGPVELPRDLRPGRWLELDEKSVAEIVKAAKSG